jgi:hypothetical protein
MRLLPAILLTLAISWSTLGQTYTITTVAGNDGSSGYSGDNGPATSAQLNGPWRVAVDALGNLYIADTGNNRVRKVSNKTITTVAGNGSPGFSGDNGPGRMKSQNASTSQGHGKVPLPGRERRAGSAQEQAGVLPNVRAPRHACVLYIGHHAQP